MKIVIDIPETYYKTCKEWESIGVATIDQAIISHGTPYEETKQERRSPGVIVENGKCAYCGKPLEKDRLLICRECQKKER